MANGVKTGDFTRTALSDELVVNREGSTLVQRTSDLAAQLASSGAIASSIKAAEAGIRSAKTWAELVAVAGTVALQKGEVSNDAGTHTDPVVGGTVANKGEYSWSTSPAGWKRTGDYNAGKLDDTSATGKVLGRKTAGTGVVEQLSPVRGLSIDVDGVGLSDMAQATVKGRVAGAGTGTPTDMTMAQLKVAAALENVNNTADLVKPVSQAQANLHYASVLAPKSASLPFAVPEFLELSTPASTAVSAATFSGGDPGMGIVVNANTPLKYVDTRIALGTGRTEDVIIRVDAQLVTKTDSGNTFGIGLAVGEGATKTGIIYQATGTVLFADGATETPIVTGDAYAQADTVSVLLLFKSSGAVYWSIVGPGGAQRVWLRVSGMQSTGRVWILVRRVGAWVVKAQRLMGLSTTLIDRQQASLDANDSLLSIAEDLSLLSDNSGVGPGSARIVMTYDTARLASGASAYKVKLTAAFGTGNIGAVAVIAAELGKQTSVKATAGPIDGTANGGIGIGFGDETGAGEAFIVRPNGQLIRFSVPGNAILASYGPIPNYVEGASIVMSARPTGVGTAEYTAEVNGVTYGPYAVTGIGTMTHHTIAMRGLGDFRNLSLLRKKVGAGASGSSAPRKVYVSTIGSDTAAGTQADPFLTWNRAFAAVADGGVIEMAGGVYRQSCVASQDKDVWTRSAQGQYAELWGSDKLVITKTAGMTQVYQAPLASKPVGMGAPRGLPVIFRIGLPSKAILTSEQHGLHRGQAYRLPYSEMFEAATRAELDTVGGRGKWFWESGVLYLADFDGGNAILQQFEARARVTFTNSASGALRFTRLAFNFSTGDGLQMRGNAAVQREDCRAFGNYRNGFSDDCNTIVAYRDEVGGNGNDGINGTVPTYVGLPDRTAIGSAVYFDPWCHDNGDDGISHHYRGEGSLYGGLYEYNTKAGIVHVNGACFTVYNGLARRQANGMYVDNIGDDRASAVLQLHNCISEDNERNYRASGASRIRANGCSSARGSAAGYSGQSGGQIIARNCRETGSLVAKEGDVVVVTEAALA